MRKVINHQWAIASHAGTLEGTEKETWQEQLTRRLQRCPWVLEDTLSKQGSAMPIISLATRPLGGGGGGGGGGGSGGSGGGGGSTSGSSAFSVRLDISIQSPTHNGLSTNALVQSLSRKHPELVPLTLVMKQFLKEHGFLTAFTGGLSSYGLVMLLTRFLQSRDETFEEKERVGGGCGKNLFRYFCYIFMPSTSFFLI